MLLKFRIILNKFFFNFLTLHLFFIVKKTIKSTNDQSIKWASIWSYLAAFHLSRFNKDFMIKKSEETSHERVEKEAVRMSKNHIFRQFQFHWKTLYNIFLSFSFPSLMSRSKFFFYLNKKKNLIAPIKKTLWISWYTFSQSLSLDRDIQNWLIENFFWIE